MDDSAIDMIFAPIAGIDSRAKPQPVPTAVDPIDVAPETQIGTASYYGQRFAGRRTASGEPFDPEAMTAAHRTLPFGTLVRITNTANDRSVEAVINDRGPFIRHRIIDVSRAIARQLEFLDRGVAEVHVEVLPPPPEPAPSPPVPRGH